ncbi:MAG: hypothetical protein V3T77_00715 [Planctomycetota bacterium]
MIDLLEKTTWGLAVFTVVIIGSYLAIFGAPTSTPYITVERREINEKEALQSLSKEARAILTNKLKLPPSGKGSPTGRLQATSKHFFKVNRDVYNRVRNRTDAVREAKKARSEVLQNKDGSNSLRIYDFNKGSILNKVGFQENDIIEQIDGKKIDFRSKLEVHGLFEDCKQQLDGGEPIVIMINRNGRHSQIIITPDWRRK